MKENHYHSTTKTVEERLDDLEKDAKTTHWWDKLQAVGPIAIAIVGTWYTAATTLHADRNQQHQAAAQLQVSREQSEMELRSTMFKSLSDQFFKGQLRPRDEVLLLGMFENNFQDAFNAGPLFALVENDLTNDADRDILRKLAMLAVEKQELRAGTNRFGPFTLGVNQATNVFLGDLGLSVSALAIETNSVYLGVKVFDSNKATEAELKFWVTYFDMPVNDNTELANHRRFAVTLKGINTTNQTAQLQLIELRRDRMSPGDRPTVAEIWQGIH